jgi:hypothetical protein
LAGAGLATWRWRRAIDRAERRFEVIHASSSIPLDKRAS